MTSINPQYRKNRERVWDLLREGKKVSMSEIEAKILQQPTPIMRLGFHLFPRDYLQSYVKAGFLDYDQASDSYSISQRTKENPVASEAEFRFLNPEISPVLIRLNRINGNSSPLS